MCRHPGYTTHPGQGLYFTTYADPTAGAPPEPLTADYAPVPGRPLTLAMLETAGACPAGLRVFQGLFGGEVLVTLGLAERHTLDAAARITWMEDRLLSLPARHFVLTEAGTADARLRAARADRDTQLVIDTEHPDGPVERARRRARRDAFRRLRWTKMRALGDLAAEGARQHLLDNYKQANWRAEAEVRRHRVRNWALAYMIYGPAEGLLNLTEKPA